jgi:hypothetical protein
MAEAKRRASADHNQDPQIELGLNAAIVTVHEQQPQILVVRQGMGGSGAWDALPFGPFAPRAHRTLEIGLREWVKRQTGLELGYVEQLYTFGDRGRHAEPGLGAHTLSVGYLALSRGAGEELMGSHWSPWYAYFPWEDWRKGKPAILTEDIEPRLKAWAERAPAPHEPMRPLRRAERLKIGFGIGAGGGWDEEKVLERYELLYEAGLVAEAARDGRSAASQWSGLPELGRPMAFDHRRILATAMGRLRGKLKYRPVVFELMPPEFTLYDLQKTVEAISGTLLHKQNFRRLVEKGGLVEPTGNISAATGGRPARLYRFRREVVLERPAPGLRVKAGRALT